MGGRRDRGVEGVGVGSRAAAAEVHPARPEPHAEDCQQGHSVHLQDHYVLPAENRRKPTCGESAATVSGTVRPRGTVMLKGTQVEGRPGLSSSSVVLLSTTARLVLETVSQAGSPVFITTATLP